MNRESHTTRFLKLFVENQKAIYSYIFSLVYDADAADDILQDTVALMWEQFESYREGTSFVAWGVTIARYKVFEHIRKNRQKYASLSDNLLEKISLTAENRLQSVDQRTLVLRDCIKKLRQQDRRLLEIRYEQQMKVKDMARMINRPIQGLYQAMSRIHNTLLRCIEASLHRMEHEL